MDGVSSFQPLRTLFHFFPRSFAWEGSRLYDSVQGFDSTTFLKDSGMLLREVRFLVLVSNLCCLRSQKATNDPLLQRYSTIILDERMSELSPDLKLIVMSATLDALKFQTYFGLGSDNHYHCSKYPDALTRLRSSIHKNLNETLLRRSYEVIRNYPNDPSYGRPSRHSFS